MNTHQMPIQSIPDLNDGQELDGTAIVVSTNIAQTKAGKNYLRGSVRNNEGLTDFIMWNSPWLENFLKSGETLEGRVFFINAEVNEYNGNKSIIIRKLEESDIPAMSLLDSPYDPNKLFQEANALLNSNLSIEGRKVLSLVTKPVMESFMVEGAAISRHDSVKHGLLAHSTKVLRNLNYVLDNYPGILASGRVDKDLLYLGAFLHDVGKVFEYSGLTRSKYHWATHHVFAIDLLAQFKDKIIELKGEEFYWQMNAVFLQHHGEYGEKPRTTAAYLIHLVDNLESKLTDLSDALENSTGDFRLNGFFLS